MKIEKLFQDHGIQYFSEGQKHCRPGWINIRCPFCTGNPGYHLGYWIEKDTFNCWRCGSHSTFETVGELLRISKGETARVLKKYQGRSRLSNSTRSSLKKRPRKRKMEVPKSWRKLSKPARQYLTRRKFNPDELEEIWGLMDSGPIGPYKFRIIAPVFEDGQMVSYQGRDFTERQDPPYKACAQEYEIEDHKRCLYGIDLVKEDWVLVVEGITDVWRMGPGAVCTFGIKFTPYQILKLKKFKKVYIMFDDEKQAQKQAQKLAAALSAYTEVEILVVKNDPGQLPQEKADEIMRILKQEQRR